MSEAPPRVFKTKAFARFAGRQGIEDEDLCDAAALVGAGRVDADLGGGVLKQRIARKGKGKSGGFRVIVFFRRGTSAFFVYGFAKSDRDNIAPDELRAFRGLAAHMLSVNEAGLSAAVGNGTLQEVECHA